MCPTRIIARVFDDLVTVSGNDIVFGKVYVLKKATLVHVVSEWLFTRVRVKVILDDDLIPEN